MNEKFCLELGEMSFFGVFSGPKLFHVNPNGDEVYNVTIVYLVCLSCCKAHLNEEHIGWRWFAAEEIPEKISPPIQPVIACFVKAND